MRWQFVPRVIDDLQRTADPQGFKRMADALLKMVKLDIAELLAAYEG